MKATAARTDTNRVLIDGRPVRSPLSGVAQYVINLARELARLDPGGIEVLTFPGLLHPNESLRSIGAMTTTPQWAVRALPRRAFTAFTAFSPFLPAGPLKRRGLGLWHATYFERVRALPTTMRMVSTIHDVAFLRHPEWFTAANLRGSRRALDFQLQKSQVIITVSEFTKSEIVELCGVDPNRILVTPLAPSVCLLEERDHEDAAQPYFLYVGNLEPRKNVLRLLQAWRQSGLGRDFQLLLIGASAYLASDIVAAVQRASATDNVKWLGYVQEGEKVRLLRRAHAFVYPSLYEGFGIPVVEAMSHGAPVVTSGNSATAEVAGDAARLIEPTDVDELVAALHFVAFDDAGRTLMRARGLQRAAGFGWPKTAELTMHAYRQALYRLG